MPNSQQASEWWQRQMDSSVKAGEDPAKAIERITAEQSTKIFARAEDKTRADARSMPDISTPGLTALKIKQHKPRPQQFPNLDAMLRRIQPAWKQEPIAKPVIEEPLPPKPPVLLPEVMPARFQHRVKAIDICNDEGEIETVRVLIE